MRKLTLYREEAPYGLSISFAHMEDTEEYSVMFKKLLFEEILGSPKEPEYLVASNLLDNNENLISSEQFHGELGWLLEIASEVVFTEEPVPTDILEQFNRWLREQF